MVVCSFLSDFNTKYDAGLIGYRMHCIYLLVTMQHKGNGSNTIIMMFCAPKFSHHEFSYLKVKVSGGAPRLLIIPRFLSAKRFRVTKFCMWHYLVGLYQLCQKYSPEVKFDPIPWGHKFYIGLNRENFINLSVPSHEA